jgi:hypothetical protein
VDRNQHPWVAIDATTNKPVLRMQRLETLLTISRSLGWDVVTDGGSNSRPIPSVAED